MASCDAVEEDIDNSNIPGDRSKSYLESYQEHVTRFQKHLLGCGDQALSPSHIAPSSYWTSSEKESFFHSLSIHSRFRPDLIAADIKSKSIADVCIYLTLLEKAAAESEPISREDFSIAMTVSESWVLAEEEQAKELLEPCDLRARQQSREGSQTPVQDMEASHSGMELDLSVAREKAMAQLNVHHLRVMDRILDDWEPLDNPESTVFPHSSFDTAHFRPQPSAQSPDNPVPVNLNTASEEGSTREIQANSDAPLSPRSRQRLRKRMYMRRKRAEQSGGNVNMELSKLQPGKKGHAEQEAVEETKDKEQLANGKGPVESREPSPGEEAKAAPDESTSELSNEEIVRKEVEALGIDGQFLVSNGLGLFQLESLGHFMGLFKYMSSEETDTETVSYISSKTIESLEYLVRAFILEVIHHAIVLKEEEQRLKGDIKVWHQRNDTVESSVSSPFVRTKIECKVSPSVIDNALAVLGHNRSRKKDLFGSLLLQAKKESHSESSHTQSPDNDAISTANTQGPFRPLPVMGRNLHIEDDAMNLEDSEMSSETEDEELRVELGEEEELDVDDCALETKHEEELWT
ncbi:hypothetical protein VNI00_003926 [Paramarasmius palmivorus]|uniref:Uncharacterized protein n=1 Tax=Paramarasmius palmivorus TaxID=297713 RepID=A0AAW0DNB3_9AGAR